MMNSHRQPTYRAVLFGMIALGVLLLCLCSVSRLVKLTGTALFFIPEQLGLLSQVKPEDVRALDMNTSPTPFEFTQAGRYAVYTDNGDLLEITDQLIEARAAPWLSIRAQATGENVPVRFVERGVTILDPPHVNGRPIFIFEIKESGNYLATHPTRRVALTVVPDYVTGNEVRIGLVLGAEIAIVGGLVALVFLPPYLRRKRARDEIRRRKREEVDRVWSRLGESELEKD